MDTPHRLEHMWMKTAAWGGVVALVSACAPTATAPDGGAVEKAPEAAPATRSTAAPPATSAADADALFVYEEAGDTLRFVAPATAALEPRAGGGCSGELPEDGNMYSGREVENAFRHPDVQHALQAHERYPDALDGVLRAPGLPGSITWATSCRGCLDPPTGITTLRRVVEVVMRNRRLVCKEATP